MPRSEPLERWDVGIPPIQKRSRLYALEPMNVGTAFGESLTGYIARLAEAHCVSVADLVGIELSAPVSLTPLLAPRRDRNCSNLFYGQPYSINGIGEAPKKWVRVLEAATLRQGLSYLTLLPFEDLLCESFLFRKVRAWCPSCLENRRREGIPYESLLWAVAAVRICHVHNELLVDTCPRCHRRSAPLAARATPGHCSRCGDWLGIEVPGTHVGSAFSESELQYQIWVAEAVGNLLASGPQLKGVLLADRFRDTLSGYMAAVSGDSLLAFGRITGTARNALRGWVSGKHRPRLGTLLQMCYRLRVPVTVFLDNAEPLEIVHLRDDRAIQRSRCKERVRTALDQALAEEPPPSLTAVARRLNYTTPERLYEIDPSRCRRLLAKRRHCPDAFWWRRPGAQPICDSRRIKELLQNSLAQEHPTSAYHIAISLGFSGGGAIWRKFPDLCRAIGKKIALNKRTQLDNTGQALRATLEENPAPSLERVCKRLGYESTTALRNYFPELCRALVARRACDRAGRKDQMRSALEAILSEEPPPTVPAVCKRNGLSESWLYNLHPDLIRAIAERHRTRRDQSMKDRRELSRTEVFQIVADLHRGGERPSHARVQAALSANAVRDWATISRFLKEAKRELGIG
jgi:transcriptional regulator with XRE-family HTH domain